MLVVKLRAKFEKWRELNTQTPVICLRVKRTFLLRSIVLIFVIYTVSEKRLNACKWL